MKCFIIFIACFFSLFASGYFPHVKDQTEVRLIATSKKGITNLSGENWEIEGMISGTHALTDSLSLSPVFKLSTSDSENSELGAMANYSVNKFINISVVGNINDTKDFGAIFILHGVFSIGHTSFMPFVKVDHKAIAQVGLAQSFFIEDVLFSIGVSYIPPLQIDEGYHNIRLMIGFGLNKKTT